MMPATSNGLPRSQKIAASHLQRHAYVYVRQSSPTQLQHNKEGRENQYALRGRAVALGWSEAMVRTIDSDLGFSGQSSDNRKGFKELVGEVSLGNAGIVLCYEASRLARNNADWYSLLDLCALRSTLIADIDGVYEPADYNDRMLLGLRGMMSEAELHLLRGRLDAGRMRQVERGTYRQKLPTGLCRLPDGRVIKDPDSRVQEIIELIFDRFEELGSVPKLLRSFRKDGILLPRYPQNGAYNAYAGYGGHAGQNGYGGELVWRRPANGTIYDILNNPAYAGAFVYGQSAADPTAPPGSGKQIRKPMEEWIAFHKDVYPAYISWERFLAIRKRLKENRYRFEQGISNVSQASALAASKDPTGSTGAPRDGNALLPGLAYCGVCGQRMRVYYRDKEGLRYVCDRSRTTYGSPMCSYVQGEIVDEAVVGAFFEAVEPSEIKLLEEVLVARDADHERIARHHEDQIRGAEYEVHLAEKHYRTVDPENRLVAAELERSWEAALGALAETREAAERFERERRANGPVLDPALRAQLLEFGKRMPELWESGSLQQTHKKELLRSLIERVVLSRRQPENLEMRIVWISGAVSPLTLPQTLTHERGLADYDLLVERTLELAREGYRDRAIAKMLTEEGYRTARNTSGVGELFVGKLRRKNGVTSLVRESQFTGKFEGKWTVTGLSRELEIHTNWLYKWIRSGELPVEHSQKTGHYLIEDSPKVVAILRELIREQPKL
jgi:DNA invertase Pin-like site-specific DNA recombinase